MAKRAGRVGFRSGQSGQNGSRVIFKRVNRVTGQMGCGSNGSGQTGLTRFAMSTCRASYQESLIDAKNQVHIKFRTELSRASMLRKVYFYHFHS